MSIRRENFPLKHIEMEGEFISARVVMKLYRRKIKLYMRPAIHGQKYAPAYNVNAHETLKYVRFI